MANPELWGPPLWRLLHSLVERLGKNTNTTILMDEKRDWVNFLKSTGTVIPCVKCNAHYRAWCTKHRIDKLLFCSTQTFQTETRLWLWGLHTEVNLERNITNLPLSEVAALYANRAPADISKDSEEFIKIFSDTFQNYPVAMDAIRKFRYILSKLRATIG